MTITTVDDSCGCNLWWLIKVVICSRCLLSNDWGNAKTSKSFPELRGASYFDRHLCPCWHTYSKLNHPFFGCLVFPSKAQIFARKGYLDSRGWFVAVHVDYFARLKRQDTFHSGIMWSPESSWEPNALGESMKIWGHSKWCGIFNYIHSCKLSYGTSQSFLVDTIKMEVYQRVFSMACPPCVEFLQADHMDQNACLPLSCLVDQWSLDTDGNHHGTDLVTWS